MQNKETFLTIIAVTCSDHSIHQIRQFIAGLYCQTDPNWKCKIFYDVNQENDPKIHYTLDEFGVDYDYSMGHKDYDRRIEFVFVNPALGQYGNPNRWRGVLETDTEWLTHTNVDNQMIPRFVETLREHKEDCEVLAFPILHSYANGKFYEVLDPIPRVGDIDYCSFMIKTDLMKQIGFPAPEWSGCDGLIAEKAAELGRWKTIRACLSVHC
jgi:hypothetical protein